MKTLPRLLALLVACLAGPASAAPWVEGTHYTIADTLNRQSVPAGKTLVTEVFSYGCPACNAFAPTMARLRQVMPPTTKFEFVPASFNPAEDWPMFQRAYLTAQVLNVADKAHDAMFRAVWTSGELAIIDQNTQRIRNPVPSIEDAARWYSKTTGVKVEQFLDVAKSFSVDQKIKASDEYIRNYKVMSTPTIIVNGKYVTDVRSAGGYEQLIELVKFLAAKG